MTNQQGLYTAPVFLGTALLLFGVALIEKLLNMFGTSIPVLNVYPSQVLGWAMTLLMFEIALTLRQLVETTRQQDRREDPAPGRGLH